MDTDAATYLTAYVIASARAHLRVLGRLATHLNVHVRHWVDAWVRTGLLAALPTRWFTFVSTGLLGGLLHERSLTYWLTRCLNYFQTRRARRHRKRY